MSSREPLTAPRLFERVFWPLYPPEARADLERARRTDANPAGNPRLRAPLDEAAAVFAELAPRALGVPELVLDGSDASVHHLAAALTAERRDALLGREHGGVPELAELVIHGVAYVGSCAVGAHGGTWQLRHPLWESLVRLESRAGTGDLAIFQWWLKALSDDEIGQGRLADRYRLHVEVPTATPEALPVLAPPGRPIPRLGTVRWDTLHKHLRAHLPELRQVGEDVPSARRLGELGFGWLDFLLVGGGRMLLVHGPTERGVHLYWLDRAGFTGSMFFPADALPEHRVEACGDKLVVTLPVLGKEQRHELLWWGPSSAGRDPGPRGRRAGASERS
ncbi:MAG: hypothetical protein HY908_28890 [Myxococcales bacterium]|nr:hypothetical protein [Myxococcales bacterium]